MHKARPFELLGVRNFLAARRASPSNVAGQPNRLFPEFPSRSSRWQVSPSKQMNGGRNQEEDKYKE
jgi:hypothetical protein